MCLNAFGDNQGNMGKCQLVNKLDLMHHCPAAGKSLFGLHPSLIGISSPNQITEGKKTIKFN